MQNIPKTPSINALFFQNTDWKLCLELTDEPILLVKNHLKKRQTPKHAIQIQ